MPTDVKMPALSPTMEKGAIARWLVRVGDAVKAGDLIAEIETDKATMEIESADEGTLLEIVIAEGTQDVPVGTTIAVIGDEGEARAAPAAAGAPDIAPVPVVAASAAPEPAAVMAPAPAAPSPEPVGLSANPAQASPAQASPAQASPAQASPAKASPLARRIAGARGIDLGAIRGSGPNGRIVKADLGIPAPATAAPSPAAPVAPAQFDLTAQRDIPHEEVKLSSMRRTIARRLTESKQQIPHIYLSVDVRLDALLALRGDVNAMLSARGVKVSVNDMLVKALALALREVPSCNVSFAGETLLQYSRSDISVAVSVPGGLITPVVKGADRKALSAIAEETRELTARARDGKLQPAEYQGGTASISNMGMMDIRQFDAVINPPQAMILAVGAAEKRAVVIEDALAIATMMTVTGSFDHRAVDGADAAALMNALRRLIEQPMGLLA